MATSNQDRGSKQGGSEPNHSGSNPGSNPAIKQGDNQSGTKNRGFASMDPARQREIASEGGKAAHQKGTAHEFTSEEARRAGSMSHGNRQAAQSAPHAGAGAGAASSKTGARSEGNKQS
ncbi:KGG domain-containing protein [Massilia sp. PWRC2]|uniref:KGG domain-containing protein n=1 Tax=Massilia sp. PWRC2 TaxID=2804626 RepID=UPI003CF5795B